MSNQNSLLPQQLQFPSLQLETAEGKIEPSALTPFASLSPNERWLYNILCWAQSQPDLHGAYYCYELGRQLLQSRRYRGAWLALETALIVCCRQAVPCPPTVVEEMLTTMDALLDSIVDLPGAAKYLERALILWRCLRGSDHAETGALLNNLGCLYKRAAKWEEASACFEEALAIWQQALEPDHAYLAAVHNNLAAIARQTGRAEEARRNYEKALAISGGAYGLADAATGSILANLGAACHDTGDDDDAMRYLKQAVSILEKDGEGAARALAGAYNNMGHLLQSRGQQEQARRYLQRALSLYQQTRGTSPLARASVLSNLAAAYRDAGEFDAAVQALGGAYLLHRRILGADHPHTEASANALQQLLLCSSDESSNGTPSLLATTAV